LVVVVAVTLGLFTFVAPSGGATAGETFKQVAGLAFFKPPLPAYPSTQRVPLKITTVNGGTNVNTCTGPAGPSGKIALTVTSPTTTNCRIAGFSGFPKTTKGTAIITWAKGKASTLTVTLTWPQRSSSNLSPQLTGTVTAGQFKGLAASATLRFGLFGGCVSTPLSKASVSLALHSRFILAKPVPPTTTTTMPSTTSTTSTSTTSTTTTTTMPPTTTEEPTTTTSTP